MSTPQPIAVFGDTVTIVVTLLAARFVIVAVWGEMRWAKIAVRWMRRIAVVSMILLVLRLISIAIGQPAIATPVLWITVAILAASAAVLMVDHIVMDALVSRRRGRS